MSFDIMVLIGNNVVNLYGILGINKIENNVLLLFDLGVEILGYMLDMICIVVVGKFD